MNNLLTTDTPMSHQVANTIRRKLVATMSSLLALVLIGFLSSCGGGSGGGDNSNSMPIAITPIQQELTNARYANDNKIKSSGANYYEEGVLSIRSKNSFSTDEITRYILSNGFSIAKNSHPYYYIDTGKNLLPNLLEEADKFMKTGMFEYAGPNLVGFLQSFNDSQYYSGGNLLESKYWNIKSINLESAIAFTRLNNVKIGFIDSKLAGHNDLAIKNIDITKLPIGKTYGNINHGFHTFGTVFAMQNNSAGIAGVYGSERMESYFIEGTRDDRIYSEIMALVNAGVKIINLSTGILPDCSPRSIEGTINLFTGGNVCTLPSTYVAHKKLAQQTVDNIMYKLADAIVENDVLIVQSAGNAGGNSSYSDKVFVSSDENGYFSSVISREFTVSDEVLRQKLANQILIVGSYNINNFISAFSLRPFGNNSINYLLAPGEGIFSLASNDSYEFMSGTSMAAPHVTGVAALVRQANPKLTASEVRNIILKNSNTIEGYPALNAEKAVRAAFVILAPPTATIAVITPTPTAGNSVMFQPYVTSSPNGGVTEYEWDFGDGTVQMGTASQIVHTYISSGTYTVILKIKDTVGVTNTTTIKVTIAEKTNTPTCTVNQTLVNNQCVTKTCPTGQSLVDGQCVTPTLVCTSPQVLQNGVCVTPALITQTITFGTAPTIASGGTGTLTATGGASGNPVILTSTTPSNCTVSGTIVTGVAQGTCTILATQAAGGGYSAGTANKTFTISAATLTCTLPQVLQNGVCVTPSSRYATVGTYPITDCVKDNTTGLIWEGKTTSGLRAGTNTYTHYDNIAQAQYWNGNTYVNPTAQQIGAATNSLGYVNAVNAIALCGYTNWRLPTATELTNIIISGPLVPGPLGKLVPSTETLDSNWFPSGTVRSITSSVPSMSTNTCNPSEMSAVSMYIVGYAAGAYTPWACRKSLQVIRLVR